MKTRFLRDIEVSEVGMGCMAFSHGYGKIPNEEYSIEASRNAYDHGCTFFDTAEVYSPNLSGIGHNELIVGKALKDIRENVVIATPAQISLAWMLHKYPNVVPIPGSKNKERIAENLESANVELTEEEFAALEESLNGLKVYGHRGLGGF